MVAELAPLPPGAASLVSDAEFGGPTTIIDRSVTVATTVTTILGNNPDRVGYTVMNRSVNNGSVRWNREVTSGSGLLLSSDGGSISMTAKEDGAAVGYALHGVNKASSGSWTVIEVVRVDRDQSNEN